MKCMCNFSNDVITNYKCLITKLLHKDYYFFVQHRFDMIWLVIFFFRMKNTM